MSDRVVEVGPATIRGPYPAPHEMVTAALAFVDDDIAILDDVPVSVEALWRNLFQEVLSDGQGAVVLVCPTWWPAERVERMRAAAAARPATVSMRRRCDVLGEATGHSTVVEIAPELVLTTRAGTVIAADPWLGDTADVARSVAARIGPSTSVVVDAPAGVVDGAELAAAVAERLRSDGAAVTVAHQDQVLRWRPRPRPRSPRAKESSRSTRGRAYVLGALIVSVTLFCIALAVGTGDRDPIPMTLLVEGRVAVKVPALWVVQRVTAGPGSARVEVVAPDDSGAVLVTQAQVREGETLVSTSATLRDALDEQPAGVFSRFTPEDRRADRPVATYREVRGGRQVDWAVFVDDTVRIAVGCQTPPGAEEALRSVCDEVIRSAHAVV